jgi:hypothetical protein
MKKLHMISVAFLLASCGNSSQDTSASGADTVGKTNPIAIDTIKHPSGVDNSSVISTDTAAMNVQNTIRKADTVKHHNK